MNRTSNSNDYFAEMTTIPQKKETSYSNITTETSFIDIKYENYTSRKSSKKVVGYIEKQD